MPQTWTVQPKIWRGAPLIFSDLSFIFAQNCSHVLTRNKKHCYTVWKREVLWTQKFKHKQQGAARFRLNVSHIEMKLKQKTVSKLFEAVLKLFCCSFISIGEQF